LAVGTRKWRPARICKGVLQWAADLDRLVVAQERHGLRDKVLLDAPAPLAALADSVPGWQTVRSFDHPATCAPQRVREWAIGRASQDGLGNARVLRGCSGHPHDRRCLGRRARFGLVPASGREPATSPVSVLGQEPEAVDNSFVPAAAPGQGPAGVAFSGPLGLVRMAGAFSGPLDLVKTVAAFSDPLDRVKAGVAFSGPLGRAKVAAVFNGRPALVRTAAASKSVRIVPMVDRTDPIFAPIVPIVAPTVDPVVPTADPVIVGPT
jgi:hypothetical protein